MSRGPRRLRTSTVVVAVVVAVAALAILSTVAILGLGGRSGVRNQAYGDIRCTAPPMPGAIVDVAMSDMDNRMGGPMGGTLAGVSISTDTASVPGGKVSFVVHNYGNLVHEMLVLPLPHDGAGTRPVGSDGRIDEAASLGEASRSCAAGAGDGLAPGSTGWVTLRLAPGRYELLCNEPYHYEAGMFDVLTVR